MEHRRPSAGDVFTKKHGLYCMSRPLVFFSVCFSFFLFYSLFFSVCVWPTPLFFFLLVFPFGKLIFQILSNYDVPSFLFQFVVLPVFPQFIIIFVLFVKSSSHHFAFLCVSPCGKLIFSLASIVMFCCFFTKFVLSPSFPTKNLKLSTTFGQTW